MTSRVAAGLSGWGDSRRQRSVIRQAGLVLIISGVIAAHAGAQTGPAETGAAADPPEIRAIWVDAFHEGIRSPREVDDLVAAASRANLNTLFVQVRRRGDALYTRRTEPALDDPAYDPTFDALAAVIEAGHRAGLRVHAWINAMPVWRDEAPPRDPAHVINRHGAQAPGEENWLTASPSGEHRFPVGYFLDPGHPAAAAYLADIYVSIVRNYAVDGIHFDYIRYPETEERLPRGAGVGYNAVNLERFRRISGRTGVPDPGDEEWMRWRRAQVTNLVRRVSIEARAINPRIVVSGALIPWGQPPSSEKDFGDVAPMQRIFQDWHQWLKDGLVDLGAPMNYAAETDDRVRGWFDGWVRWEKRHAHGRHLIVGLGAYRNTPEHTLAQIARVRRPDGNHRVAGVSFFSYAAPVVRPPAPSTAGGLALAPVAPLPLPTDRLAYLADGSGGMPGAFARPAPVPAMPWIETPERGWIAGEVPATVAGDNDTIVVKVTRRRWLIFSSTTRVLTDGNGYFGVSNVEPGTYTVKVEPRNRAAGEVRVRVTPGKVTRALFCGPDCVP